MQNKDIIKMIYISLIVTSLFVLPINNNYILAKAKKLKYSVFFT
jgi:hypothetical protein